MKKVRRAARKKTSSTTRPAGGASGVALHAFQPPEKKTLASPTTSPACKRATTRAPPSYCDAKVANREIRVWHFVIENGY
jgi:hypothetical protein